MLLLCTIGTSGVARAHQQGLSFLDLQVSVAEVDGALDVPAVELSHALQIDADRDGRIEREDVEAAAPAMGRWLGGAVRLVVDGRLCRPSPATPELRQELVTVRAHWTCDREVSKLELASRLHESLGEGHSTVVRATAGQRSAQGLLTAGSSSVSLDLGASSAWAAIGRFVLLGIEHIFTGIDHVLFLLTLILLGGSLRRVIAIATSFTAAHSITLSLAALGVVTGLSSRLVESAIAASIAWVAVENYLYALPRTDGADPSLLRWRWLLTFVFGLVHGFGFASALSETGLPADHLPLALASFNVGVEAGQVAIISVAWPLITRAAVRPWYRPRAVQVASLGVFSIAVYWFVQRAFL